MKEKKFDLEERLIQFSLLIIDVVEALPRTRTGNHLAGQLLRSGTSPAFNYGEAQAAESRADFVHKMKICLKELKESAIALQIIHRKKFTGNSKVRLDAIVECDELVLIFSKSISTASRSAKVR